jgi:hypothetical protein
MKWPTSASSWAGRSSSKRPSCARCAATNHLCTAPCTPPQSPSNETSELRGRVSTTVVIICCGTLQKWFGTVDERGSSGAHMKLSWPRASRGWSGSPRCATGLLTGLATLARRPTPQRSDCVVDAFRRHQPADSSDHGTRRSRQRNGGCTRSRANSSAWQDR